MITIGLSDTLRPSYQHYETWVKRCAPDIAVRTLSSIRHNAEELGLCSGLVLTGGGDVHPKFYAANGPGSGPPGVEEVNAERDEFELGLFDEALRMKMPILGICRGMQLVNVALGGTLIPDVKEAGYADHRKGNGEERLHPVQIENGTHLRSIVHAKVADVNTNHHQAVDRIGTSLRVSARSDDGLVESLERGAKGRLPLLLLIQWHPERMRDFESPCSKGILERFITEVRQSHTPSKHLRG